MRNMSFSETWLVWNSKRVSPILPFCVLNDEPRVSPPGIFFSPDLVTYLGHTHINMQKWQYNA